jgi:hypothetical protein
MFDGREWSKSLEWNERDETSLSDTFGAQAAQRAVLHRSPKCPNVHAWSIWAPSRDMCNGFELMQAVGLILPSYPAELRKGTVVFVAQRAELLDVLDAMAWRLQAFGLPPNCSDCMLGLLGIAKCA